MAISEIMGFSVGKKKAFLFFLVFALSIAITAIPIATISYIGPIHSLQLMFIIEFIVGAIVYCLFFLKTELFALKKRTTLISISILFFIQLTSYVLKPHSIGTIVISQENIFSLLILVFVVPFYEEVFYRGCLLGFFCTMSTKYFFPIISTSLVFCLMHTQYHAIPDYLVLFFISVVLCVVRIDNKNLLVSFFLHMSMNAFVVALNIQNCF
jgi:hypothetical protein